VGVDVEFMMEKSDTPYVKSDRKVIQKLASQRRYLKELLQAV
jgi:hypothetical protein